MVFFMAPDFGKTGEKPETLQPGERLGHFEIVEHLGSGGMGSVYKAHDTRLGRTVAVKVLDRLEDESDVVRFEREARLISRLNHEHICTLHDVGQENDRIFLVMEYLPGETLAERLQRGRPPLEDGLLWCVQIAEALEAAHRQGVIHRDLKPSNVLLTDRGACLVDFGIAKSPDDSGTITVTEVGSAVGTAPYMSPEQLEGKQVDSRSDLFSFGAMAYEIFSGEPAFQADSRAGLAAAILTREPEALTQRRPDLPPALDHVLSRCLAKDPAERWQTAADLQRELEWAASQPLAGDGSTTTPAAAQAPWLWVVPALVAIAGLVWWGLSSREQTADRPLSLEIRLPAEADPLTMELSPDGRYLVWSNRGAAPTELQLRSLETGEVRRLAGTEGGYEPFWSPDSRSIGYLTDREVRRVGVDGGAPTTLAATIRPESADWGSQGTILLVPQGFGPIRAVSAEGGELWVERELESEDGVGYRKPRFLPNGNDYVFQRTAAAGHSLWLASLDGDRGTELTASDSTAEVFSVGGEHWLLFAADGALVSQRLDLGSRRLVGERRRVASHANFNLLRARAGFTASRSGMLASLDVPLPRHVSRWTDRDGRPLEELAQEDFSHIDISPGAGVAVAHYWDRFESWAVDLESGRRTAVSTFGYVPVLSPDGRAAAYSTRRTASVEVRVHWLDGSRPDVVVFEGPTALFVQDWTPQNELLVVGRTADGGSDVWRVSVDDPEAKELLLDSRFDEGRAKVSPDGNYLAYVSDESGRFEVYVEPYPRTGARWLASQDGGDVPAWSHDGRHLHYIANDGVLQSVELREGAVSRLGPPRPLFPVQHHRWDRNTQPYQSVDAERFLVVEQPPEEEHLISVRVGWRPES